jgi:formate dehydrogenase major subunit
MTRRSKSLLEREPELYLEINSKDARNLDIESGEEVKISSRRGETFAKTRVTQNISPGVIFMPFHFMGTNFLTNDALCPIAKTPEFKVAACKVEKVSLRE